MNIFTLNPDAKPNTLLVLPEKVCNKGNSVWLLNKVVQPALLSIMDIAFGGVANPIKSKLSKKEVIEELKVIHNYCTTYGITTVAVGHAEIFKYISGNAKFTLNFGNAVAGVNLKVSKEDYLDFTNFKIIPFLNPVILNIYPNKVTEVVRGLSVISSVTTGTYSDSTSFEMEICEIITDPARATEVLKQLWSAPQLTADIETTGLDWYRHNMLTISFSPRLEEAYCFALADQYHDNPSDAAKMRDLVGRFFTKYKGEFIGHNFTGFDTPFLLHMHRKGDFSVPIEGALNGIKLTDTILMAYILKNSTERPSIGLKELVYAHMGQYDKDVDQKNLVNAPLELVAKYNNYDCRATWLVYNELNAKIDEGGFREAFTEMNTIAYDLVKMKMHGLRIDLEKVKSFREELKVLTQRDWIAMQENEYVQEAIEAIAVSAMRKYNSTHKNHKKDWTEFKTEFNPASPKQKQVLFFDLMNLPVVNKSKVTKQPSADAGTISEWLDNPKIPQKRKDVIMLVQEYMTAQKVKSTYVEVMAEKYVEVGKGDYRMFTNFNQTATITGRLSSSGDINLQTIPNSSKYGKKVKELFIAPEGFILGTADYNALEDRLIANESQDENKLNIFLKGIDGHCLNAYGYFKEEFEERELEFDITDPSSINKMKELAPDLRQNGKPYTFGFTYGAGPNKYGQALYKAYWETYGGVKVYNDNIIKKAMTEGYLVSKFSGLRLWLPSINSIDEFIQAKEWRVACNFSIQSGNFLMLRAIHKIQRWIEENDLLDDVKLILTVHDSVYLYVKNDLDIISLVNKKVVEFMGEDYEDNQTLPLTAELDIGTTMLDFNTIKESFTDADIQILLNKLGEKDGTK